MSDRYFISDADLRGLAGDLIGAGTEVIAPVATDICQSPSAVAATVCTLGGSKVDIDYRALASADELDLSRGLPQLSLKGYFLPEHEALCRWKQRGITVEVEDVPTEFAPARRAGGQALRRRRPRGRRQGHELGLQGRALERPPRSDHHRQPRVPR